METGEGGKVPPAPTCEEEFTKSWAEFVLGKWLAGQERGAEGLLVTKVNAVLNSQQVHICNIVYRKSNWAKLPSGLCDFVPFSLLSGDLHHNLFRFFLSSFS